MATLVMSQVPSTSRFGETRAEVAYEVFDRDQPGRAMRRVWVPYVFGGTEADVEMMTKAAAGYLSAEAEMPVPVAGVEVVGFELGVFTVEVT